MRSEVRKQCYLTALDSRRWREYDRKGKGLPRLGLVPRMEEPTPKVRCIRGMNPLLSRPRRMISVNRMVMSHSRKRRKPAAEEDEKKQGSFESGMSKLIRENPEMARSLPNDKAQDSIESRLWKSDGVLTDELADCEPAMVKRISQSVMRSCDGIEWSDICGLDRQKQAIQEIVIWPMKAPQLFTGLLEPPKGVLLFGPPGTGKTMIAKACAAESQWRFLSVSASSLTSKWFGTAEKMVKALFAVANLLSPSVVFIDEIDSLLCQRTAGESDAMRRIKTELLVALDGTKQTKQVLVIGATNRPQELDDAARRRLVRRLYIPLPSKEGRFRLLCKLLSQAKHEVSQEQIREIAEATEGYSGADITQVAKRAAMKPLRDLCESAGGLHTLARLEHSAVRPLRKPDLVAALSEIRPSVAQSEIEHYVRWNQEFGCTD